ncbi:MAG: four helix bundle protein [Marinilabiliales bacterium]|nr:MAG: four helix bundle protein [Marinilabiliales bacterium]
MFDFEKLDVYQTVRNLNSKVYKFIYRAEDIDQYIKDQWKRASLSSMLNLAEGVGRMSKADKKHFITISRGSIFECVAILQSIYDLNLINEDLYIELYSDYEKASKMLLGLFRSFE